MGFIDPYGYVIVAFGVFSEYNNFIPLTDMLWRLRTFSLPNPAARGVIGPLDMKNGPRLATIRFQGWRRLFEGWRKDI